MQYIGRISLMALITIGLAACSNDSTGPSRGKVPIDVTADSTSGTSY